MKRKWIIFILLIALIALILAVYILIGNRGNGQTVFSFDSSNIISIEFLDGGNGESTTINSREEIEHVISFLNKYTYTSEKDYIPFEGYVYVIRIYEKTSETPICIYPWENTICVDPSGKEYINAEPDYFNSFIADWFPDRAIPPWS